VVDQRTILVADDDPDITDLISSVLSEDNHRVVSVWDGLAAIDLALREAPDIVILDLNMPKSDGFEVIRRLREHAPTRNTPIILLTANNDEGSAAKGFAGGADDFLVKPFTPAHLRARVATWLLRRADHNSST
jgi:two-component system OmpR family response regulator